MLASALALITFCWVAKVRENSLMKKLIVFNYSNVILLYVGLNKCINKGVATRL